MQPLNDELALLAKKVGAWALEWLPQNQGDPSSYRTIKFTRSFRSGVFEVPDKAIEAICALREKFAEDTARAVAAFYCLPCASDLPLRYHREREKEYSVRAYMTTIAECFFVSQPSKDANSYLLERLKGTLSRTWPIEVVPEYFENEYTFKEASGNNPEGYFSPHANRIAEILADCINPEDHWEECSALMRAAWNSQYHPGYGDEIDKQLCNSYDRYYIGRLLNPCIAVALERNEFDYNDFCRLAGISISLINNYKLGVDSETGKRRTDLTPAEYTLCDFTDRYVWEAFENFNPTAEVQKNGDIAERVRVENMEEYPEMRLPGYRWLIKACEHIEKYSLSAKAVFEEYSTLRKIYPKFARVWAYGKDETPAFLQEALQAFKPATLWMLFPFAGLAQRPILTTLKAESLIPLHEALMQFAGVTPYRPDEYPTSFENSEDEESGVVDVETLENAINLAPVKLIKEYFKSLKDSKMGFTRAIYLCEAVMGSNRAALEKSIDKHNQIALKALGLLPLQDKQDAVNRYIRLKRAWKECSQYGAERQSNTRAAITVGFKNLARRAGYRDVSRLEWDMESSLSEQASSVLGEQSMGEWSVRVELEGLKAKLQVSKGGKTLKSVPAGLRKVPGYEALREQMKTLDEQARRFRLALEDIMCDGEAFDAEELAKLDRIVAVRFLLENLLGIDDAGQIGLINSTQGQLSGEGGAVEIQGRLRIAHVHDLYQSQTLSYWQRRLVEEGKVQPFKQAFRELYVVTPAELESSPVSRRYHGRNINTAVGYRLLQSRGWQFSGAEGDGGCTKRFSQKGIGAYWHFPGVHHFFTEDQTQVADIVQFYKAGEPLPLADVPAVIFSEVMRDADLVVSVAVVDDAGGYWSEELNSARLSVVRNVLTKLGFDNLSVEGHFVYVQGKLAKYRIHLGSGNIHIMPGAYLCIIPDRSEKEKPIYLPFVDSDRKTAEIISKAILLTDDDCIEDASITKQINVALAKK